MAPDGWRERLPHLAAGAVVMAGVAGVGLWARGAPAEVPLKIEAAPAPKAEASPASAPAAPLAPRRVFVHVAGEVFRPGVYELGANGRVADALRLAGGPTVGAAADRLNLAAVLRDGQKIVVPRKDDPVPPDQGPPVEAAPPAAGEAAPLATAEGAEASPEVSPGPEPEPERAAKPSLPLASISLNTAGVAELDRLPGVGPATAEKIVAERERRGGFRSVDDLLDVRGIGPAKLAKMRPYLTL